MSNERLRVLDKSYHFNISDELDGMTIHDVIQRLTSIQNLAPNNRFMFDVEYVGYDGAVDVHIHSFREETDDEYNSRLEALAKQKQAEKERKKAAKLAKEAKEREEYERLAKKFGKSVTVTKV